MTQLEKRWQIAVPISPQANENLSQYSPVFRQVLYNRGISTAQEAEAFLKIELTANDPYQLSGLGAAVERIVEAIEKRESVVVYGDYDADGVTSTALMTQTLEALGAQVKGYIPDRFDEGYGLNKEALEELKQDGADLVITVDCGIRALAEAEHARELGLDLVITDHHTPGPELPWATALINPKQPGDAYPEKNLAGVGTAFKLASALIDKLEPEDFSPEQLLDLVAIGTVADLVPLVGENRALVQHGLHYLRTHPRQGVYSLLGVSGVKAENANSGTIGFSLGPRLNAAGRVASAMDAYKLLLTRDIFEAGQLAQGLDNRNRERQKITQEIQEEAEAQALAEDPDALLLFAADPDFNPGVVGLAASRLVDKYYRPAIVAHHGEDETRASCRSIPEFDITNALEQCADLLVQFGGHAAAAGFTVKNERLPELLSRLHKIAQQELGTLELRPVLHADAEVALVDLKPSLLSELDLLQPTGYGNPQAVFVSRGVWVKGKRAVGKEMAHLKLTLSDGRVTFDAIAFRQGHWIDALPDKIDLLYNFELNEFNGRTSLQLNVQDIKASK